MDVIANDLNIMAPLVDINAVGTAVIPHAEDIEAFDANVVCSNSERETVRGCVILPIELCPPSVARLEDYPVTGSAPPRQTHDGSCE